MNLLMLEADEMEYEIMNLFMLEADEMEYEIMNLLMLEADEMEYEINQRNQAERETAARFKRLKDDLKNAIDQTSIQPKKVIFQNPATIVYWADGSRTIVKACKEDTFNEETGLAMAYLKHLFGDNAKEFHKLFNLTDVDICRRDSNAKAKRAEKKAKAREKAKAKERADAEATHVVTDSSGELVYSTGQAMMNHGYRVEAFNEEAKAQEKAETDLEN